MKFSFHCLAALTATGALTSGSVVAETWKLSSGTANWVDATNWVENSVPNSVGAAALFTLPAANRNIDLNGSFTVGSVTFDNTGTNSSTQNIRNFNVSGDLLTFDAPGAGPATITSSGTAATNSRIQSDMYFADSVDVVVSNTVGNSTAGALSLTGNITGPGGMNKKGDGLLTTAFNAGDTTQVKEYQGATTLTGGRWRSSLGGIPTKTSSFTINGGQLDLITNNSTYTLGVGPLNLNGFGATSGPFAAFPGAIRQDTGLVETITNNVVFQSDASIAMFGSATSLTLTGSISGPGRFYLDAAAGQPTNHGTLTITGANNSTGGTSVVQGTLVVGPGSSLGIGNVLVDGASDRGGGIFGSGKLVVQTGATNAIADTATLTLTGGANGGTINLAAGIDDTVGGLILGGVTQTSAGTYGSMTSSATFKSDYFLGDGVVRLLAPPGVPGDYNGNGTVDAADYVLWRNGGPLQNEVDNPGTVDSNDYSAWRARFGNTSGSGAGLGQGTAVPEPTTLALVAIISGSLAIKSRRRFILLMQARTI